jgi:4-amino-4-deoxy-L-arabinose transferase-like glycosyltransferase
MTLDFRAVLGHPDQPAAAAAPPRARSTGRAARVWRGRPEDPRWVRPGLVTLLIATAVLYLWGLSASGWANSFYAAAVQAGSTSWKAFFFGSSDAGNSITVDKPPASLWVMALSARMFGMSSWSMLVPEALMGVGTVGLLYLSVRRRFGAAAGLLSGAVLALTPIAVLMFRFNNPDALLVLLMVGAVYAMQRALEYGSTKWMVLVGTLIGFAFLTKMMQALLIVPGLALVWLIAAPTPVRKRIGQLLLGGVALLVSAGWWVAIVELMPASARPYIGGSQHNSVLELVLGYNGLGRLSGNETGSVGGGGGRGGGGMWGQTGWLRMFDADSGGQISWLIPAALLLAGYLLYAARRAKRIDLARADVLLWLSWLLVTMATFSFMAGIYHAYYEVALAPAVAALVGMGAATAWARRRDRVASVALAGALVVTAWWSAHLLHRSPQFHAWLAPTVLIGGLLAAIALLGNAFLPRRLATVLALTAVLLGLAGPTAYALNTANTPHTGSIPTAGPSVSGGRGGPGGGGFGRGFGGQRTGGQFGGRQFGGGQAGGFGGGGGAPGGGGGAAGGLLDAAQPGSTLTALLKNGADGYSWVAAAVGSNTAAGYQLASGAAVMPVGGFNGSDPSPTLAQFQADVAAHKIHYFIGGGRGGFGNQMGGSQAASEIASWVSSTYTAQTVDGVTLYDLTASSSTAGVASATGA